jgi:Late embryogenesis abundant (LEA) group 1
MQSIKEKTANTAASAKAGMEKTKASVDEKVLLCYFI